MNKTSNDNYVAIVQLRLPVNRSIKVGTRGAVLLVSRGFALRNTVRQLILEVSLDNSTRTEGQTIFNNLKIQKSR